MHLHKQKLTKYFRGHYIIMVGVTNFKELGVTFSCSVFLGVTKKFPTCMMTKPNFLSIHRFCRKRDNTAICCHHTGMVAILGCFVTFSAR